MRKKKPYYNYKKHDLNEKKQKIINLKNYKKSKTIYKNGQKIIKFDDTEIEGYKFYQYENSTSIKNIDINKIVVFNKFPLGKQDFRYFIGYKILKKLDLYAYSIHKSLYIKETLMKINILIF